MRSRPGKQVSQHLGDNDNPHGEPEATSSELEEFAIVGSKKRKHSDASGGYGNDDPDVDWPATKRAGLLTAASISHPLLNN